MPIERVERPKGKAKLIDQFGKTVCDAAGKPVLFDLQEAIDRNMRGDFIVEAAPQPDGGKEE